MKSENLTTDQRIELLRSTVGFLSSELVKSYKIIIRLNAKNNELIFKQMKKPKLSSRHAVILLLLWLPIHGVIAQDDLYYIKEKIKIDTLIKSDITNMQYCLGSYYKERQIAYGLTIAGGIITAVAANYYVTEAKGKAVLYVGAAISLAGGIVFYDSEKWLKRASIKVGPAGIRVTF